MMTGDMKSQLANIKRAVSRRSGIVRECIELMIDNDDPPIFYCATNIADTTKYNSLPCYNHNGGAGLTRESAYLSALCESLERYCVSFQSSSLIEGSYADLSAQGYHLIHPDKYQLFSRSQYGSEGFRFERFTEDIRIKWVQGDCLTCSGPALVPACLVYIPYVPHGKEEPLIAPSISTGLACGSSRSGAILSGLLEVIERDAFSMVWLNMLESPRVILDAASKFSRDIFEPYFDVNGLEYVVNDLRLDIDVPVFLVTIIADTPYGRAASCGCACRLDPEEALKKAFVEAAQSRVWIKQIQNMDPEWSYSEFKDIRTFEDHVKLYGSERMLSALDFLRFNGSVNRFPGGYRDLSRGNLEADVQFLLDVMRNAGMEAVAVDVTTPDVEVLGFKVIKIVVPQAHPLHGDHNYRFLGGNRLYEVPVRIGGLDKKRLESELNQYPHPFP